MYYWMLDPRKYPQNTSLITLVLNIILFFFSKFLSSASRILEEKFSMPLLLNPDIPHNSHFAGGDLIEKIRNT